MNTNTLAAAVIGFLLGGLTVSIAAELEDEPPPAHGSSNHLLDRTSESAHALAYLAGSASQSGPHAAQQNQYRLPS